MQHPYVVLTDVAHETTYRAKVQTAPAPQIERRDVRCDEIGQRSAASSRAQVWLELASRKEIHEVHGHPLGTADLEGVGKVHDRKWSVPPLVSSVSTHAPPRLEVSPEQSARIGPAHPSAPPGIVRA